MDYIFHHFVVLLVVILTYLTHFCLKFINTPLNDKKVLRPIALFNDYIVSLLNRRYICQENFSNCYLNLKIKTNTVNLKLFAPDMNKKSPVHVEPTGD